MLVKVVVLPSILFVALLGSACGDGGPSAPSPTSSPVPSAAPPPTPAPIPDLSKLVGMWNLTVRVTAVSGSGCVAETLRSQIGLPSRYSLSITQADNVKVTLRSASGDYACTFTPVADSNGFTTYGQGGYYTCEQAGPTVRCKDGTLHSIFSFGEDISGHLSGTELSGTWDASWFELYDSSGAEMKAQFTGTK